VTGRPKNGKTIPEGQPVFRHQTEDKIRASVDSYGSAVDVITMTIAPLVEE
jgi:hypothetical protein